MEVNKQNRLTAGLAAAQVVNVLSNVISVCTTAVGLYTTVFHGWAGGVLAIGLSAVIQVSKALMEGTLMVKNGKNDLKHWAYVGIWLITLLLSSIFSATSFVAAAFDDAAIKKQMEQAMTSQYTELVLQTEQAAAKQQKSLQTEIFQALEELEADLPDLEEAVNFLPSEEELDQMLPNSLGDGDSYLSDLKAAVNLLRDGQTELGLAQLETLLESIKADPGTNYNRNRILLHQSILAKIKQILSLYNTSSQNSAKDNIMEIRRKLMTGEDAGDNVNALVDKMLEAGKGLDKVSNVKNQIAVFTSLNDFRAYIAMEVQNLKALNSRTEGVALNEERDVYAQVLTDFREQVALSQLEAVEEGEEDPKMDAIQQADSLRTSWMTPHNALELTGVLLSRFNMLAIALCFAAALLDLASFVANAAARKLRMQLLIENTAKI